MYHHPELNPQRLQQRIDDTNQTRPLLNVTGANIEAYPNGDFANLRAVFTRNTQVAEVIKGQKGYKQQLYISNTFINSIGKSDKGIFINVGQKAQ